ncbi:aspartate aminotransferase family protein [Candidatus Velamenicoccus archaeovorus]|uniref:Acetylornithine aminotransferase n=1 Tax=Velamenicoccus archaeovorus TaxID=1930593 RepID=A0A410P4Z4_VELA1|nr:aspartate aminotransferase family protein [Candidatus Velamenicoccus archaeovorus]QAT17193.1 aspartate aminotransferase family protein [Candidatus Velamenicoccus archaeovorus]
MTKQDVFDAYNHFIMPTYTKMPYIFVKGKGMKLYDIDGREYLDFFPGWGVGNVGHCHPAVLSAVRHQLGKLIHLPNNYYHPAQAKLASEIIRHAFDGKVFFSNSGAEANEAAIKLCRAYGAADGSNRYEILTFENAFHGRTLATITATGQEKYQKGFEPLVEGFRTNLPLNDIDAVLAAVTDKTVAIMLEVVQGEGGINVAAPDFVRRLRQTCDERKMLLVVDEVQTGIGRTGKMFGYQHYGITPDIMTLAKSLGGGLPIGCMVARREIADTLKPGTHASTFGGSPVVCRAALGVFRAIQKDKMLQNATRIGAYLLEKFEEMKKDCPSIKEVRGLGLMIGLELTRRGKPVVDRCLAKGLLINCTHDTVLRLMPALNVTKKQADTALKILGSVLREVV